MPLWTVALGLTLNLIGVVSWLLSGNGHITALIPAFVGGLFLLLGFVSFAEKLRKHVIHGALALALLLGGYMVYEASNELINNGSVRKLFAFQNTGIASLIYVVIGVRSFLHARKLRKTAERAVKSAEASAV
ncbi:MAG: hypothetical protein AAFX76_02825 [Planctomycetota bacterium]